MGRIMSWCWDHGIKIYPKPVEKGMKNYKWWVMIERKGKFPVQSPEYFTKKDLWEVINNYYIHFYEAGKERN